MCGPVGGVSWRVKCGAGWAVVNWSVKCEGRVDSVSWRVKCVAGWAVLVGE